MIPEISVVILCYRAGHWIRGFVDKIVELLDSSVPSWEIVLVGNYFENTDDDTPEIVMDIVSKRENIKAVVLPKEGMMGWDARSGLNKAIGRYICLIDGDRQMPAEDIVKVYRKIKEDKLDFVTTYRAVRYDGAARVALSCVYNLLFKVLFPGIKLRDINSKPKILTREAYNKMHLVSNDWFFDAEVVIQTRGLKLKTGEVPTRFYRCPYRKSFVRFDAVIEFIKNLFYARFNVFFK